MDGTMALEQDRVRPPIPSSQVGKRACFTEWTLPDLLAPPTPEEIEHAKNATKDTAKVATQH